MFELVLKVTHNGTVNEFSLGQVANGQFYSEFQQPPPTVPPPNWTGEWPPRGPYWSGTIGNIRVTITTTGAIIIDVINGQNIAILTVGDILSWLFVAADNG
jgi:hypothetical protein